MLGGIQVGRQSLTPGGDEIVFRAICMNLKHKRWGLLGKFSSSSLTNSFVNRVIQQFQMSPQLALDFFNWVMQQKSSPQWLESYSTMVHVLVNARRFEDALSIMRILMDQRKRALMQWNSYGGILVNSFEICYSSPALFDTLVRACMLIRATEDIYIVIEKLRMKGYLISIHAWNNIGIHS